MPLDLSQTLRAALLATAAVLGACGGDLAIAPTSAAVTAPAPAAPEAAGAFAFALSPDKGLRLCWTEAAGAQEYRLFEDADGASGYAPLATLPASSTQYLHAVLPAMRINARYRLQACNSAGCTDSAPLALPDSLARAVDYLKASNTGAGDQFGGQVALSADGQTLAVGAALERSAATGVGGNAGDNSSSNSGAVYVFTRRNGAWQQQAYLKASNTGANDAFGSSLALSADGDTLAVGARFEDSAATGVDGNAADDSSSSSGAVYVFTRSTGAWQQQAYLKASNTGDGDQFGYSVALSADGHTLAVGAWQEDSAATGVDGNAGDNSSSNSGAVYVFTRSAGAWQAPAYLKAANAGRLNLFGAAVALSADGLTLAVSAPLQDADSGAVYVFARSAGPWQQQAYLKASNRGNQDLFGAGLALSADGLTLAASAINEDSAATGVNSNQGDNTARESGAVYVFSRQGSAWQQQAYVKASNTGGGDLFGTSLALSADGAVLAVGSPFEDSAARDINGNALIDGGDSNGAVYLFARQADSWQQQAYVKAPNADVGDRFGHSVALSGAGHALAVGAVQESSAATGVNGAASDNSAAMSGAVYLY